MRSPLRQVALFCVLLLVAFPPLGLADAEPVTVVDESIEIGLGVPDEIVLAPPNLEQIDVPFTLATPVTRVVATLSWPDDGVTDIDFELLSPTGARTGTQGQTFANPEVVELGEGPAGEWRVQIYPFLSVGTTARLVVVAWPAGHAPLTTRIEGDREGGQLDTIELVATAGGGVPPYAFAWDTDGDGAFETAATAVGLKLAPGVHEVTLRTTDALGAVAYDTRTLRSWSADRALHAVCGGDAFATVWAMEYNQTHDTCWVHDGHHTWFTGDTVYALREVHGWVFAVEQQLAPSADAQMRVQVSMDGLTWTEVGRGQYVMLPSMEQPFNVPMRQVVRFGFEAAHEPFRYLRVHSPPSLSQGLSGYLDHSDIHFVADELGVAAPPVLGPASSALACETSIMERFFEEHPCTYGGVDRWDSASFYHTYVVGDGARVDRVRGSFVLAPFRTDDFWIGSPNPQQTLAYLITSADGRTWTHRAVVPAVYGVPASFDVALDGSEARFVRLFPEYHARFWDTADSPSLHHPRGYFVTSEITVDGLLPV